MYRYIHTADIVILLSGGNERENLICMLLRVTLLFLFNTKRIRENPIRRDEQDTYTVICIRLVKGKIII